MPDPFTPCDSVNPDGIPCWRCKGHCGPCEVHPFHRKQTSRPVWSREFPRSAGGTRDVSGVIGANGLVYSDADPGL